MDYTKFISIEGNTAKERELFFISNTKTSYIESLYNELLIARNMDNTMCRLQKTGELIVWPSLHGQEAISVAAIVALRELYLFLSYREHAIAFDRFEKFHEYIGLFKGVNFGNSYWNKAKLSACNLLIGDQTIHAVGYANASLYKEEEQSQTPPYVGVFFGDGAMSQGATNEAFLFAASFNIPILFLCINNQYAISSFHKLQSQTPFYKRADGFGIQASQVNGNNLVELIYSMQQAVNYIKKERKPYFLECLTYRIAGHTTIDNHLLYRSEDEIKKWEQQDPIKLYEKILMAHNIDCANIKEKLLNKIDNLTLKLEEEVKGLKKEDIFDFTSLLPLPEEEELQLKRYIKFLMKRKNG